MPATGTATSSTSRFRGRIGYAGALLADDDLWFQYNPATVQYSRRATYSNNQAAFADFPNSPQSAIPPISWIRNEAEDISIELIFDWIARTNGTVQASGPPSKYNVEDALLRLDDFMKPDPNTGKPRDLFFSFGNGRSDRIRILEKTVNTVIHDANGQCIQAKVQLKFKCLSSRVRS